MTAKRRNRVVRGNSHLTVYRWTHPSTGKKCWRFAFQQDGKWKYRTHNTKEEAEIAAGRILDQQPDGLAWDGLDIESRRFLDEVHRRVSPGDRPAVLAFLRSRDTSTEIGAAVAAFVSHKKAEAGELTPHLTRVSSFLNHFAVHFTGRRVSEIQAAELRDWLAAHAPDHSGKSRKHSRAHLVSFFRWALKQGIAGSDPVTAADRLPAVAVASGEKRILAPEELARVLKATEEEFRAWIVLGAFAGMRPEEICPATSKRSAKRGLHCEEIDWTFHTIRVPACVSKVNTPRNIPITEALRAGLQWAGIEAGMTGPVCLRNPAKPGELARLGKLIFDGQWPQDALRHSYGSYRNALLRNLPAVAEEMGTSVTMLNRHYHNPRTQEEGQAWFAIRPPDPMRSEENQEVVDSSQSPKTAAL